MSHEQNLQHMPVKDLAQQCAQETNLYLTHHDSDTRYCLELFRRAISERDDVAWRALIEQYKPSVEKWVNKWVNRHPNFSLAGEEEEDFVAEAFERFWKHFTPEKFSRSQGLDAVLKYLKMCVHGATSDMGRKMRYRQFDQPLEDTEEGDPDNAEPESTPEDILQRDEFWQLIKKKSRDDKEYIVIFASFNLALTPREIFAEYPGQFRDIKEIYQYKANLLERLERDADFREFARQ